MHSKVIILNGRGGVGKDTFVDLCSKYINSIHISSITPIKTFASLCGWSGTKTEKDRKMLSDLKDIFIEYDDTCFKYVKNQINKFYKDHPDDTLLFVDIREPDEIDKLLAYVKCTTCLITNSRVPSIDSNHSDRDVENYHYDFYISNDSTLQDLDDKAKWFVQVIKTI